MFLYCVWYDVCVCTCASAGCGVCTSAEAERDQDIHAFHQAPCRHGGMSIRDSRGVNRGCV